MFKNIYLLEYKQHHSGFTDGINLLIGARFTQMIAVFRLTFPCIYVLRLLWSLTSPLPQHTYSRVLSDLQVKMAGVNGTSKMNILSEEPAFLEDRRPNLLFFIGKATIKRKHQI